MLRLSACRGFLLLGLLALTQLSSSASAAVSLANTPGGVKVDGSKLMVDGAAFQIKGMAYSPVPVGENVNFAPFGDYFTPDYAYLWYRDLEAIKAMGVNTIRIYAWAIGVNHRPFLDTVHRAGMKVILTHYIGDAVHTPVKTAEQRLKAATEFGQHVKLYGDHPAILMWSIGNELNGAWLQFKTEFSAVGNCYWTQACEGSEVPAGKEGDNCFATTDCVYKGLWGWINQIATEGKKHTTRPITTPFADVDRLVGSSGGAAIDRLSRFDSLLPAIDLYMIQVYRGRTFGDYFSKYAALTKKPLVLGEYGVDAYNDQCGWPENFDTMQPCTNKVVLPGQAGMGGSEAIEGFVGCKDATKSCAKPGEVAQMEWNTDLTKEILAAPSVIGGILVEWHDENWKGIGTQDFCATPCKSENLDSCLASAAYKMGGSAKCSYKAHVTCSNYNTMEHDMCGYFLASAPDQYVNEEWFGMNSATDCGVTDNIQAHRLTALKPRPVVASLQQLFGGTGKSAGPAQTCDALKPCWQCTRENSVDKIVTGACDAKCGLQFAGSKIVEGDAPAGSDSGTGTPSYGGRLTQDSAAFSASSSVLLMAVAALLALVQAF